jgi:hypothetical protein
MSEKRVSAGTYMGLIEDDKELTSLLGIFVARWSMAEYVLMLALMVALQTLRQELATTILASTTSAEAKIQIVLKTLNVSSIDEDRRSAIREAVKALSPLCAQRNALMHHLWGTDVKGGATTIDYRQSEPSKMHSFHDASTMRALINKVVDAAHGISEATLSKVVTASIAERLKV